MLAQSTPPPLEHGHEAPQVPPADFLWLARQLRPDGVWRSYWRGPDYLRSEETLRKHLFAWARRRGLRVETMTLTPRSITERETLKIQELPVLARVGGGHDRPAAEVLAELDAQGPHARVESDAVFGVRIKLTPVAANGAG